MQPFAGKIINGKAQGLTNRPCSECGEETTSEDYSPFIHNHCRIEPCINDN